MLVKIFNQGTSNGKAHIAYLFNEEKHKGFKPQLLKGNALITEEITGSITNKNKYLAGVIAFRDNEKLEKSQLLDIIDSFEATIAPFADKGRVNFLWVLHKDKNSTELHFISPRIDLKSKKSLDLHPNTKANLLLFEHFTRATNYKYGFEQVDKKEYKKGNFDFSKKIVRDLVEKRAVFFQSKYCEMKKNPYNKNNKNKRIKNGMGTTRKISTRNNRTSKQFDSPLFNSGRNTKDTTTTPRNPNPIIEQPRKPYPESAEQRAPSQGVLSLNENDFKPERKTPKQSESRSSTQKANDLRSSPLFTQLQEIMALYSSEQNSLKRMELFQRMLELRYQIEIQEEAKKLEQEKNKLKFK